MVDSPLAPASNAALASPYSQAFMDADKFIVQHGGDRVPQSLRHQYWQQIGGDALAKADPQAAMIAYDTAIASDPQTAIKMVRAHKGDAPSMYKARSDYVESLIAKDPTKYAPLAESWRTSNANMGRALGIGPQQGQTPGQTPAQATPTSSDAMVNNILRTIKGGESGGKYGITSFAEGKGSTASGGYQFADPTWREWAHRTGGEAAKYSRAKDAPPQIQDAVARNYVADILRRNNNQPSAVFREWYAGPKGYLTPQELAVNKGLTVDKYLENRMASYNKIASGQSGPEKIESGQTPQTPQAAEKTTFDKAADAVSSGMTGAAEAQKPQAAPIPITKPNVPLPTEPIAPAQRDMYAKALEAISKRNAATPPTQPARPADAQEKAAPAATPAPGATPEPTPEKEAVTPNDNEA